VDSKTYPTAGVLLRAMESPVQSRQENYPAGDPLAIPACPCWEQGPGTVCQALDLLCGPAVDLSS